jgi:hypothetical protein
VLLLRLLLGLEPHPGSQTLRCVADKMPDWVGDLQLSGVRAFGRAFDVRVEDGHVTVSEA